MWLDEANEWIYPHLRAAQERMTALARKFPQPAGSLRQRALKQAARELLLAQASDWPFILRSGTHADYARRRVETHLLAFNRLHKQILAGRISTAGLVRLEKTDDIFPEVDHRYWA